MPEGAPGFVTDTFLVVAVAPEEIVKVVVIVVEFTTVRGPTVIPPPTPLMVMPLVVKFVPVNVTETVSPRWPELGVMEDSVGAGGLTTVKVAGGLVPAGVVTVTEVLPSAAFGATVKFAVICVSLTTVIALTVIPVLTDLTDVAPVNPLPLMVTASEFPRWAEFGLIEEIAGPTTMNVSALLVPPGVVTVTLLAPEGAVSALVKVAVMVVELTMVTALMVIPEFATATVVPVVVKFVPVRVTDVEAPRVSEVGLMEVSVGGGGALTVNVTALLIPPGAVTVILACPTAVVVAPMANVAVIFVLLTTIRLVTVMPAGTLIEPLIRFVPVRVTA